jgi:hypothetical protein
LPVRRWLIDQILRFLTEPLPFYERRVWNDPNALRRHIRKGDVLLVNGDNRISAIIRYLTQSSWSHAALYLGDEVVRRGGPLADEARRRFGDDAEYLILEALPDGVVTSPLTKYIDFNMRLVRPDRLSREHLQSIMDEAVGSIGWRYDLRNILDLARFLIPVSLVPARFRRTALHFGSGTPTEVICSSLIGQLFQRVRFPILPTVENPGGFDGIVHPRRGRLLRRVFGHESARHTGIFRMRHPTLLTPADFDLSPFFHVIKFNVIAGGGFDYQQIQWARDFEPAEGEAAVGDGSEAEPLLRARRTPQPRVG